MFIYISVILSISIIYIFFQFVKVEKKIIQAKHVMISGGSSGIGLHAAKEALLRGANVTLLARDESKLKAAKEYLQNLKEHQGKVLIFSVDVGGTQSALQEAVQAAENSLGPVYQLINCAGYGRAARFEDTSHAALQDMMNVNFVGSYLLTQEVVKSMKRVGEGGSIVFVSSIGGLLGIFGYTAYSASKAALVKMAESLHMELKPHNIYVTVCYPPDTNTPGFEEENKTKPDETRLISGSAGVIEPEDVAKSMMEDALVGKFSSYRGFEGFMITTMCAGMGPISDALSFISQVFLSGLFRSISFFYLWHFGTIVKNQLKKERSSKKAE